jgi:hypothetical protein
VHREHPVHASHVDADAAADREHVPFERGACAERDDGHAVRGAQRHDFRDFFRRGGIDHCIRRFDTVPRFVLAMVLEHRRRSRHGRPEPFLQCSEHRVRQRLSRDRVRGVHPRLN